MSASTVKFQSKFGGMSTNADGHARLKLVSPYSETGFIMEMMRWWTSGVHVLLETKRKAEADFTLSSVVFKPDSTVVVVLTADARSISEQMQAIVRMKGKEARVTVTKGTLAADS